MIDNKEHLYIGNTPYEELLRRVDGQEPNYDYKVLPKEKDYSFLWLFLILTVILFIVDVFII